MTHYEKEGDAGDSPHAHPRMREFFGFSRREWVRLTTGKYPPRRPRNAPWRRLGRPVGHGPRRKKGTVGR